MDKDEKGRVCDFKRQYTMIRIVVVAIMLSAFCNVAWATVRLPVQRQEQENGIWCWAACCQTILNRHYAWVTQCDMANWVFSRSDCCTSPTPGGCENYVSGAQIVNVLEHYWPYVDSTYRTRALTKNECWDEIDAGRPFVICWDWDGSGGHAIVGVGISNDKNTIYWMDPATTSIGGYWQSGHSWVVDGCDSFGACHTWGGTVETDENPGTTVNLRHTFDDNGWDYETSGNIYSSDFEVRDQEGPVTEFEASYIYLGTGFEVKNGAEFEANLI